MATNQSSNIELEVDIQANSNDAAAHNNLWVLSQGQGQLGLVGAEYKATNAETYDIMPKDETFTQSNELKSVSNTLQTLIEEQPPRYNDLDILSADVLNTKLCEAATQNDVETVNMILSGSFEKISAKALATAIKNAMEKNVEILDMILNRSFEKLNVGELIDLIEYAIVFSSTGIDRAGIVHTILDRGGHMLSGEAISYVLEKTYRTQNKNMTHTILDRSGHMLGEEALTKALNLVVIYRWDGIIPIILDRGIDKLSSKSLANALYALPLPDAIIDRYSPYADKLSVAAAMEPGRYQHPKTLTHMLNAKNYMCGQFIGKLFSLFGCSESSGLCNSLDPLSIRWHFFGVGEKIECVGIKAYKMVASFSDTILTLGYMFVGYTITKQSYLKHFTASKVLGELLGKAIDNTIPLELMYTTIVPYINMEELVNRESSIVEILLELIHTPYINIEELINHESSITEILSQYINDRGTIAGMVCVSLIGVYTYASTLVEMLGASLMGGYTQVPE